MQLNSQQKKAVEHMDGPCLVVAIPGSGKTSVLVSRTVRLIEKGVNPANIICLTFTNKAANEMKQRIKKMLGTEELALFVGTFHSFCVKVLRGWGSKVGLSRNFTILDASDQESIISMVGKKMGFKKKKDFDARKIATQVNKSRENVETLEAMSHRFDGDILGWEIAQKYLETLQAENIIDFSGLLYEAVRLLDENPKMLEKLQNHFHYAMIDEMQDTNAIQFRLINMLGGTRKNLLLTGDPSQSLYAFRGARYQNIGDFLAQNKNCAKIALEKNYRSTPEIIKVADTLIKHNKSHMNEKFETDNPSGSPVECHAFPTPADEAKWIAEKINWYKTELGFDGKDIAVFYRLNRLSLDIQPAFRQSGIPFVVVGGANFFDRREIKDTLAMLRFLSNPKDSPAFYRVIDLCPNIGEITASKLHNLAVTKQIDLITACKSVDSLTNRTTIRKAANRIAKIFDFNYESKSLTECFDYLMSSTNYKKRLEHVSRDESDYQERQDNLDAFVADAIESTKNSPGGLNDYLRSVSLVSSADQAPEDDCVTLMSIHSAKGLEFPIVFIVGVEQKILPHYLAIEEAKTPDEKIENIGEERRIAYVGMTRAETRLHVSFCRNRKVRTKYGFRYDKCRPSQFINEAGISFY